MPVESQLPDWQPPDSSVAEPIAGWRPAVEDLAQVVGKLLEDWGVREHCVEIEVVWNPRLRTTAGRARVRGAQIELNPHLLSQTGRAPALLSAVLTHEAAHLVAVALHGRRVDAHGVEWRALMHAAGLPPDVTHDIDVTGL